MRGIADALKKQRLRRTYPLGVHISRINVRGQDAIVTLTNLKNGDSFEPIIHSGYLANLYAALHREALIAGFRAAGVHVEEGFLWRPDIENRLFSREYLIRKHVSQAERKHRGWKTE